MKKKTAILLAGTMIASTILAGCGSKEEGAANQVASEELKGDITFWHSFTQGPRLEVIQETADQFMKEMCIRDRGEGCKGNLHHGGRNGKIRYLSLFRTSDTDRNRR